MADWATISSLTTGAGTLVLAVATFASVRSANRSARASERLVLASLRPVLAPTRLDDPVQKIGFMDNHFVKVEGGRGVADVGDDAVYFVIGVRNVGSGLAVLHGWDFYPERAAGMTDMRPAEQFHRLQRDIYVPAGDIGFWQGAFRDPSDPRFDAAADAVRERRPMTIDILYGDHEGGQRAVARFGLIPVGEDAWLASVSRHWNLDRDDPR